MKYQIAQITIDPARYRVSSGGIAVPVEPKVVELLVYLIRNRGRVLTRDELFREIWAGREVSDATLSNHVMSARRVLGDSGEAQQTIQTVRGRGYRFVAAVVEVDDAAGGADPVPAAAPAAQTPAGGAPRRNWPVALAALAVLLVAGLALVLKLSAPAAATAEDRPYVLVVPFDVSGAAPEAWGPFADQVTRELIRKLRTVSGLRVVPAPSAFVFKGRKAREHIRAQLPEVRYVLDGAVSIAAGNQLRIGAELEDLQQGRLVWDQDYTGRSDDTDLFAMQSQIAAAVSESLKVALLASERRALGELPTADLKAYELYVAGRHQMDLLNHESLLAAVGLFDDAIRLDPQFFDAYLARGAAYRQLFSYFEPPINMLQAVIDSLTEAQKLRPDSAEVWSSLGLTYAMAWRWKDAWIALNAAKKRNPALAETELGFALYYTGLGEAAKVRQALAEADRLDPLNIETADWGNWAQFIVGEHGAARAWAERKMRQHPDVGVIYSGAGVAASVAGDHERALRLAERGAELDGSAVSLVMLAHAYAHAGRTGEVRPLLDRAAALGSFVCPYESAAVHLALGDRARALALLEEAVEKRSNCLVFLRSDPRMRVLHGDARYERLLARVGLDDTALASYKR